MLNSNHAPMIGTLTPDRFRRSLIRTMKPAGSAATMQVRAVRLAERIRLGLELAEHLEQTHEAELVVLTALDFGTAEALAQAEAIYDLLHDDEEAMLDGFSDPYAYLGDNPLTDQDVEDILTERDDDARIPGSPGWGEARVDYSEFVSGFRVTDRP